MVPRPLGTSVSSSRAIYSVFAIVQGLWKSYNADPHYHTFQKRKISGVESIVFPILIPVLVLLSGLFAGLTLGYLSLDETQLNVLSMSGTPKQREYANKIKPVRKNGHLLLVTLLLANMITNETLPVIADPVLGGGVQSVVVSTTLIVIFAEIIPQSLFTRYGLYLGAKFATLTKCLIYALGIISWPTAKLLEFVLGSHHGIIYRRAELKELINMHAEMMHHGGDLASDTVTIIGATLDLQEKVVRQAMTPIADVFMLSIDAKLDYDTLKKITATGHSRVPVYEEIALPPTGDAESSKWIAEKPRMVKRIIGVFLVKHCVLLDPKEAVPLRKMPLNKIPSVPQNESLLGILDKFQEGRSHIAVVSRQSVEKARSVQEAADVVKRSLRQRLKETVGMTDSDSDSNESQEGEEKEKKSKRSRRKKDDIESGVSTLGSRSPKKPTMNLEQSMPDDAVLGEEGAKEFLQVLDPNIMPLGIITLEDVLEELIGEEIYDEFDAEGAHGEPLRAPLEISPAGEDVKPIETRPAGPRRYRKFKMHRSRSAPSSPRPAKITLEAESPSDAVLQDPRRAKRGSFDQRQVLSALDVPERSALGLTTPHRSNSAAVASILLDRKRSAAATPARKVQTEPGLSVRIAGVSSKPSSFKSSPIPSVLELGDDLPSADQTESKAKATDSDEE
ncbi:hypothetical protein PC9H_007697 [Pleurotus ostreatus]|uniref:CNNM transmembrane domain-containing protein n=2 Tax=Pleurotus ostreatus TaxID=5322 RepID=A0A067NWF5_PLEO1|nr:uncharacterized protein PC9H_007697 [Pleurotus ostreatus]KAF7428473.1 hypothetical protein PC9H_007697 [Pleurotus ostreatus]KDQ27956.1 hypothetical protein PLEOSDRAFT_1112788 [Pleurotus ostreatus PC15]